MSRVLVPGDYHPDHQERVERLQRNGSVLCGHEAGGGWLCVQPVMKGSEHCYKHSNGAVSPVRRVNDADLRLAAEYFARGATGKQVGDLLGLTPNQAYQLKRLKTFPEVRKHEPKLAPVDLERVGVMKTGPDKWTALYG